MTATLDLREGFVVAAAPAVTSHARVVVRTDASGRMTGCDPAMAVFQDVNAACCRFDPDSELCRINDRPADWHVVSTTSFWALREAWYAYQRTSGRFDPRLPTTPPTNGVRLPWRPRFADTARSVHVGGEPIDLDAVARGLALRWASRALQGTHHLIEVGDSYFCAGRGPDGEPWRMGIDDPLGDPSPLAVLGLSDTAASTASFAQIRPTGPAAGEGLLAVTVLGPDPVATEVWSAVLLLDSAETIAKASERRRLAAAWVTEDGKLHVNATLESRILWER